MTFSHVLKEKYKILATEGPSTGHHNAAQISQSEAIDSFMHYILKKDAASAMAADTATYIAEHKISDETARAFARAVSEYARQIQPKGKEIDAPSEPSKDDKSEGAVKLKVGQKVHFEELKKDGVIQQIGGPSSLYGDGWAMVRWADGFGSWVNLKALKAI